MHTSGVPCDSAASVLSTVHTDFAFMLGALHQEMSSMDWAVTCMAILMLVTMPCLVVMICWSLLQGRGGSTGYDNAVALPARSDSDELAKENTKSTVALRGQAVFSVAKVDPESGEIAGVFESIQPSDTDLGSKAPKDIKITGLWYGQLNQ